MRQGAACGGCCGRCCRGVVLLLHLLMLPSSIHTLSARSIIIACAALREIECSPLPVQCGQHHQRSGGRARSPSKHTSTHAAAIERRCPARTQRSPRAPRFHHPLIHACAAGYRIRPASLSAGRCLLLLRLLTLWLMTSCRKAFARLRVSPLTAWQVSRVFLKCTRRYEPRALTLLQRRAKQREQHSGGGDGERSRSTSGSSDDSIGSSSSRSQQSHRHHAQRGIPISASPCFSLSLALACCGCGVGAAGLTCLPARVPASTACPFRRWSGCGEVERRSTTQTTTDWVGTNRSLRRTQLSNGSTSKAEKRSAAGCTNTNGAPQNQAS